MPVEIPNEYKWKLEQEACRPPTDGAVAMLYVVSISQTLLLFVSLSSKSITKYNSLIVVGAAVFAYRTRNVPSGAFVHLRIWFGHCPYLQCLTAFNENTFTSAAAGLISVIAVVIVPVINFIDSPEAM